MKVFKLLVLILVFSVSLFAEKSCKIKELLEKTSISYNVVSFDTAKTNFYEIYQNRQKIYHKLYNYIINRKDIKYLLTCSSSKECEEKASVLALKLIFYVKIKFKNAPVLLRDLGAFVVSSLWRQSKNAWDIVTATSVVAKNFLDKSEYIISLLHQSSDIISSDIFTKDNISFIVESFFPSLNNFLKDPNLDNLNKLAINLKNLSTLIHQNGNEKKVASLVANISKLLSILEYQKLYYLAKQENDEQKSCINLSFFTYRELNYLDKLDFYIYYDMVFVAKDIFKDLTDLMNVDSVKNLFQAAGAALDGFAPFQSERETMIHNIITDNDLINDKLDIENREINNIIKDYSRLNSSDFFFYLITGDESKAKEFISIYNSNINYLKKYYPNELLSPLQHKALASVLRSYYRNEPIDNLNTIVDTKETTKVVYERKKIIKNISNLLGITEDCDPNINYYISIFGKNNSKIASYTARCRENQYFILNDNNFKLDMDKAYRVDNKSNLYYFKFKVSRDLRSKNTSLKRISVPIYVRNSIRLSKINIQPFKNERGHLVLTLSDNFGLLKFYYDKEKAKLLRLTDALNLNSDLKKYVLDNYSSPEGIYAKMNIIDFKLLMEKNLDDLKEQGMDFRATKYYKWLEKEFNNIINKKELYVPAWFSKLYTTTLLRFEHYMIKNKKYNVQAKEYENWYLDKFINSTVDTKIRFKLLVYLNGYKRRFFKKYKYLPIYKNLLIFNYLSSLASKGGKK